MTRSKRSLMLLALVALVLTLAARNDAVVRTATDLLGPRAALFLPSRVSLQAEAGPAHGAQPAAPAVAPPAPAPRSNASAPSATVTLTVQPSAKLEQGYVLEARLVAPNGKPLNEATVRFYEPVELLGQREMFIGSAATDGQGSVSLAYLPARLGRHEIILRSPARDQLVAVESRMTFEATVAAAPYRPEHQPLSAFSAAVPAVVGVIVLGVWALIAFALLGTARGVGAGRRRQASGTQASLATRNAKTKTREDLA
ncbi:MAG: hypothetical protein Q7S25_00745 [Candidatus Limnocylindria bacterium]|nr:hypothetical protein [Candidatus Limnocylindria bacterium]